MPKQTVVIAKRKKFQEVDVPIINSKLEVIGNNFEEVIGKTIKLDLTRQLKGKGTELTVKLGIEDNKLVANPIKIKLMSYFIRRMIRKRISYVEDSFFAKSQESLLRIKPFLITRNRVSRSVRKTLRNKTRNWLEDYLSQKNNSEIFSEIISNKLQKTLSLILKKTYPLSLCEIRILEVDRALKLEEIPKKIIKKSEEKEESLKEEVLDQLKEIEEEKIKEAEEEIKKTQAQAIKKEIEEEKIDEKEIEDVKKIAVNPKKVKKIKKIG